jgi:hypothetical protein
MVATPHEDSLASDTNCRLIFGNPHPHTNIESAAMIILLVTWFYYNQAPQSTHTAFKTEQACEVARQQILNDADRLASKSGGVNPARRTAGDDLEPNSRPDRLRRLRPPVTPRCQQWKP